jgi:hypothetical protein
MGCCFFGVRGFRFFGSFATAGQASNLFGCTWACSVVCRQERGGGVLSPGPNIRAKRK